MKINKAKPLYSDETFINENKAIDTIKININNEILNIINTLEN